MNKTVTIAITGAAGQISYALLFRIASGQVFGKETQVKLNLLEIPSRISALKGVVMELEDCAFPLLKNIVVTDNVNTAMKEANWAILVGSTPRTKGMERSELLKINGGIFAQQGRAINDHAASDVRVLVVGNPCNTNCLIAMNNARDIPRERFFAMTRLDENRAKAQLAIKANVSVSEISNMIIWGNHSSTQYPDFYQAVIRSKLAPEVVKDEDWVTKTFIPTVQQRGAAIIDARGSSSAASAANAIVDTIKDLTTESTENRCHSVCCVSSGQYGVKEGLIFSFPCYTENGVNKVNSKVIHKKFSLEKIKDTIDELQEEYRLIQKEGLI